ncbi:MAG: hypothetical protein LBH10_03825 [Burkholderiaceae bacterium]|nr:hypothetical protein [Burkholderiaceae bacterium]
MSLTGPLLTSCALPDAPPLDYQCPHDLRFTARLYRDMAMLDGMSGHAVLARQAPQASDAPAGDAGGKSAPLRYADDSVRAQFGLGEQGRLARLDYTDIPEPVYCARIAPPGAPVTPPYAINRDGPRPPPLSPNPDAPVITNIRTGDGADTRLN